MDPERFVRTHNIRGGTGPDAMAELLGWGEEKVAENNDWHEKTVGKLHDAQKKLEQAITEIQAL